MSNQARHLNLGVSPAPSWVPLYLTPITVCLQFTYHSQAQWAVGYPSLTQASQNVCVFIRALTGTYGLARMAAAVCVGGVAPSRSGTTRPATESAPRTLKEQLVGGGW